MGNKDKVSVGSVDGIDAKPNGELGPRVVLPVHPQPFRGTLGATYTPVSDDYASPFVFTGTIKRVMIDVSEAGFDELASEIRAKIAMAAQ